MASDVCQHAPVRHERAAWLGGCIAVHAALFWLFGGHVLLSATPYAAHDYATHFGQVVRVLEGWQRFGHSWVYDVRLLAGQPAGMVFNGDNHGIELLSWLLVTCGMSVGAAFNAVLVLYHALPPVCVFVATRLWGGSIRAAGLAAASATMLWAFDSWTHWCWYIGMISYAAGCMLALVVAAAWWSLLHIRSRGAAAWVVVGLPVAHLVHPYVFFMLAPVMITAYVARWRDVDGRTHVVGWSAAALTLAVNGYWLHNAWTFRHEILPSDVFAESGALEFVWDLLGLAPHPATTGVVAKRTAVRVLAITLGCLSLHHGLRRGDSRALPLAVGVGFCLMAAYVGSYTPLAHTQPYRNVLPATLLCVPAAAWWLDANMTRLTWQRAGLVFVVACAWVWGDVRTFLSPLLPRPSALPSGHASPISITGDGRGDYRHAFTPQNDLRAWMDAHAHARGASRVLVRKWDTAEWLAATTDAQIMGGFVWRNVPASWSNLFRQRPSGAVRDDELLTYARRYAISHVVVDTTIEEPWWSRSAVLEPVAELARSRVYRVRAQVSLTEPAGPTVVADTNRVHVQGSNPTVPLLLRYHFDPALRCTPACRLRRKRIRDDRVGFIEVQAPHPSDFVIYNAYGKRTPAPP